jgi:hypothetical protein
MRTIALDLGDPDLAVADLAGAPASAIASTTAVDVVVVDDDLERTLGTKSILYSVPR